MYTYSLKNHEESRQFHGTIEWYRYDYNLLLTDGVKWLAEEFQCFWLLSDIGIYSFDYRKRSDFSVARFETKNEGTGILYIEDGNDNIIKNIHYPYSDLYIDKISLKLDCNYFDKDCVNRHKLTLFMSKSDSNKDVLMLPSEY